MKIIDITISHASGHDFDYRITNCEEREGSERKNIKFNKSKHVEHNRKNHTNIENLSRN